MQLDARQVLAALKEPPMHGTDPDKRFHRQAVGLMAGAVMFFSTNALFVELTLGDNHPFLYNAAVWMGLFLGLAGVLLAFYRPVLAEPVVRRVLYRRVVGLKTDGVRRWDLVGMLMVMMVGRLAFAFFGWATQYVETATVSILHYMWPVIFVLGLSRWDRSKRGRYRKVTALSWAGLALAFAGMAGVVIGTLGLDGIESGWGRVLGMVMAAMSAVLMAGTIAFGYPLGAALASEINDKMGRRLDQHRLEFSCLLFAYCVSALMAVVPNVLIGMGAGGRITWGSAAGAVAVGLSFVPGAVLSRKAVLITPDLTITAIVYVSPVVGLLWLGLFTQITVARLDLLVLGAVVVAVANIMLNWPQTSPFKKLKN
jgi:drug/metabolite transporter (DMT)-like permease